jgi:hypothetical protein
MEAQGSDLDRLEIVVRSAADAPRSSPRNRDTKPRHAGVASSGPATLRRYQHLALLGDAAAAVVGTAVGDIVHPANLALVLPVVWVAVIAAAHGYERRFLCTGPQEYRRVLNAALTTFVLFVVVSFSFDSALARGYLFTAVPLCLLLTVLGRRQLRRWILQLRVRGLALSPPTDDVVILGRTLRRALVPVVVWRGDR